MAHPEKRPGLPGRKPPKPSMQHRLVEFLKSLGFAVAAVIVLNSVLLASFQVPTSSMENTVMAGDYLFVNKLIYGPTTPPTIPLLGILFGTEIEIPYVHLPGLREPERGDVIVFIWPGERDKVKASTFQFYLKRCVAVAGDTLRVVDKQLYINGRKVPDQQGIHYISPVQPRGAVAEDIFPPLKPWNRDNYGPLRIPKEGDVVQLRADNAHEWLTFIRREGHTAELRGDQVYVDGTAVRSYRVERNYCFGMGDNRDDSLDSRFWGFIPENYIVGTPMMVYWSADPSIPSFIRKLRLNRIGTIIG